LKITNESPYGWLDIDNIRIHEDYRRLGLATKMYQYVEELIGKKLKPSPIKQSKEIRNFWAKVK
jgi:ribosomal protein S18 acetylase RimI-like enzyme